MPETKSEEGKSKAEVSQSEQIRLLTEKVAAISAAQMIMLAALARLDHFSDRTIDAMEEMIDAANSEYAKGQFVAFVEMYRTIRQQMEGSPSPNLN